MNKNCRTNCRWTAEEDAIISKAIEKNKTVIDAINEAFKNLKSRSYLAVYTRIYNLNGGKGINAKLFSKNALVKPPCNKAVKAVKQATKTAISFRVQVENDHIRLYF